MPFPSPSLTPPSGLTPYQFSYQGLAFGGVVHGAAYQLQSMPTGLDLPNYVTADQQRALDQGEFAGIDLSPGRDVTIAQVVQTDGISQDHARQALAGVLGPQGNTEQPLYVQLPSGLFACMARPRKHNFTFDINMVFAGGGLATTLFHATDPRWYAQPSKSASVNVPGALGGMTFPATFPLSFGGGGVGALVTVVNNGLMEMRPVLVVTGPCTNPIISNLTIPGAPQIGVTIALNTGDTLVIDTDFQTVLYTTAGTTIGSSRRNSLMAGSTWWNLPPGPNQIEMITSTAGQGTLTVQSADAFMGL